MMKYVVIGLIAAFILQSASAEDLDKSAITDKITEAIQHLQEKLEEGIENAKKAIEDAVQAFYEKAQALLQETKQIVAVVLKKAIDAIHDMAGTEPNAAAQECIKVGDEKLSALNDGILKATGECIEKNALRVAEIADETLNGIKNLLGFISEDLERLHKCEDAKCFLQLLADVGWQSINLPRKIFLILDHSFLTITSVSKDIFVCKADAAVQAYTGSSDILKEFKECVREATEN